MNFLIKSILGRKGHLHPGDRCPEAGQYTYSKASPNGKHRQRGCEKGETMPPPPPGLKGGYWMLTDATRT